MNLRNIYTYKILICFSFILCLVLINSVNAQDEIKPEPVLNTIAYNIQAESWVESEKALITVSLNASIESAQAGALPLSIRDKLNSIAQGDWHIVRFERESTNTGLEKVTLEAQTRLPTDKLSDLRTRAKSISHPGMNYEISAIEFQPTLAEMEHARTELRSKIYQQVKAEIATLQSTYPKQQFFVHEINYLPFVFSENRPPQLLMAQMKTAAAEAPPMAISQKIILDARVSIADLQSKTTTTKKE